MQACLQLAPRNEHAQALQAFGIPVPAEELAAMASVAPGASVPVWPEHWLPLRLFQALGTQWRMGPGGPVGLVYEAAAWVIQQMQPRPRPRAVRDAWPVLQAMETDALALLAEQRDTAPRS